MVFCPKIKILKIQVHNHNKKVIKNKSCKMNIIYDRLVKKYRDGEVVKRVTLT